MKTIRFLLGIVTLVFAAMLVTGCDEVARQQTAVADTGVRKATATVQTGSDGLTQEQRNIKERLRRDNLPGSIKHLYVFSAYSGQVLIYSTVKGKVSSSGKRLTPKSVVWSYGYSSDSRGTSAPGNFTNDGVPVVVGGRECRTNEVLQDDGTYGDSIDYIYWFDSRGVYHQHYLGDEILHISDQPLAVKNVIINMELTREDAASEESSTAPGSTEK